MVEPTKKLDLDKESLKVYIFTAQEGALMINVKEDLQAIMAHTEQAAVELARQKYPLNKTISLRKRAEFPVAKMLQLVKLDKEVNNSPIKLKKLKKQEFINSVLLVADKFVENKRDQASLKRIINKITKNHEPSKTNL